MLPSTNLDFCEAPTSRAPTLFCQGTNLGLRSTNSQDTNPSNSEAPTSRTPILPILRLQPQRLRPNLVKACLIVVFFSQNSSFLSSVCLQLHCSLHATASMATSLHMKKSLQLFILSTQSLKMLSHDDIK